MEFREFYFTQPIWLLLALLIPCFWGLYFFFYRKRAAGGHQLEKFIDAHLIPYLLVGGQQKQYKTALVLGVWSIVWLCLTLALAGPRWNFRDIEVLSKNHSLVVVLDLSESMNAADVKPSRLGRAKQKIEDLINVSEGMKMGFVVFAADPHMITPVTEDKETIRRLLPSIGTDLMYIQGSRLSAALEMGAAMLKAEPGNSKGLLVISDGGFEDSSAIGIAKRIAEEGILVYTMGVGGEEGIPLRDKGGNVAKKEGTPILSRLDSERLREVSMAGKGRYLESHYGHEAEKTLVDEIGKKSDIEVKEGQVKRLWDEGFYLFALPAIPIMLWWFRRGHLFALMVFLLPEMPLCSQEYFRNSEQIAKEAFDKEDYAEAAHTFQDCYRKGVAHYVAGNFAEAEKMFKESTREEVACKAAYNLGNALAFQNKFKEAVAAYEEVLNQWSDHAEAKENLALIKKMMEEQNQDPQGQGDQESDSQSNQNQDNHDSSQDQEEKESGKNDQPSNQNEKQTQDQEQKPPEVKDNSKDPSNQDQQRKEPPKKTPPEQKSAPTGGTPQEMSDEEKQQADFWLDRIENDPKAFLKNKCYVESKKNNTKEGIDPW